MRWCMQPQVIIAFESILLEGKEKTNYLAKSQWLENYPTNRNNIPELIKMVQLILADLRSSGRISIAG